MNEPLVPLYAQLRPANVRVPIYTAKPDAGRQNWHARYVACSGACMSRRHANEQPPIQLMHDVVDSPGLQKLRSIESMICEYESPDEVTAMHTLHTYFLLCIESEVKANSWKPEVVSNTLSASAH